MNPAIINLGVQTIDCNNIAINGQYDSTFLSLDAEIADYNSFKLLNPENGIKTISILVDTTTFNFIIEGHSIDDTVDGETYNISGRSITAKLDYPFSDPITRSWSNTLASAIITELCTEQGITFSWNAAIPDLIIKDFFADEQQRIDIIKSVLNPYAETIQLQSTPAGDLEIKALIKNPKNYDDGDVDFNLTRDKILSLSSNWERRGQYDYILIGNESIDESSDSVTITIEHSESGAVSDIKVYVNPFTFWQLEHASLTNLNLQYNGIRTETLTDENVVFDLGVGGLSKPVYAVESVEWLQRDLGALSFKESGEVTAAVLNHSLANVTFTSKYYSYTATNLTNIAETLLYVQGVS